MSIQAGPTLIETLTRRGLCLWREGDKLIVSPPDLLTDADRDLIRRHKAELMDLLADGLEAAHALGRACEAAGTDLAERLDSDARLKIEMERDTTPLGWTPAHSILDVCRRHGVALRIDEEGDLVVGKSGAKASEPTQPWPSLLAALEAHIEDVVRLIKAGWLLKAGIPHREAA